MSPAPMRGLAGIRLAGLLLLQVLVFYVMILAAFVQVRSAVCCTAGAGLVCRLGSTACAELCSTSHLRSAMR